MKHKIPVCLFCGKPLRDDRICEEACSPCAADIYWESEKRKKIKEESDGISTYGSR